MVDHHRKVIRLDNRDYTWSGDYFVTIFTQLRECYLGEIKNGILTYSQVGEMARSSWVEIPSHFDNVKLGPFIVMPNHLHGIISITTVKNETQENEMQVPNNLKFNTGLLKVNQFSKPIPKSLSVIVSSFKASVTRWCNKNKHAYFAWQPRYYERIIRDANEFRHIEKYILDNPTHWDKDEYR